MNEHVQLLIVPHPELVGGVPRASAGLKRPVSTVVLARWREIGWRGLDELKEGHGRPTLWQPGGGFDRNVRDADEFAKTIDYIHHNPVRAGLLHDPRTMCGRLPEITAVSLTPSCPSTSSDTARAGIGENGAPSADILRYDFAALSRAVYRLSTLVNTD
jgi:hypothetical protein